MLGGGAGSIQHMITTLRNNRNLLKRVSKFKDNGYDKHRHKNHVDLEFKHATPEELEAFKKELKKKIKIQQFINGLILGIFVIAALIIFIFFYRFAVVNS